MAWVPGGNQVAGPDLVAAALPLLTFMELASRLFAFLHHDPLDSSQFFLGALQVFAKLFLECRATAMLTIDTLQKVMVPAGLIAFLRKIVFDVINPPVVLRPAVLGPGWDREGCPKQAPGGEQHNANRQSQPPGDVGQNVGSVFSTIIFKIKMDAHFLVAAFYVFIRLPDRHIGSARYGLLQGSATRAIEVVGAYSDGIPFRWIRQETPVSPPG